MDDHSDAGSEHANTKPKEVLSISHITSVETVPVAAPITQKQPTMSFGFSNVTSIDTPPVASAATVTKKKPTASFGLSNITSVETMPIPAAATVTQRKPTASFGLSDIMSVETTPIPAPEAAPTEKPAPEIRVQWRTPRTIYKHVDHAVVPWWMWFLFVLAIATCAAAFAGLLREKQIWFDANDLAYQRLMGAEQETWLQSVGLGVQDLLPGMGPGGTGYSLFD